MFQDSDGGSYPFADAYSSDNFVDESRTLLLNDHLVLLQPNNYIYTSDPNNRLQWVDISEDSSG